MAKVNPVSPKVTAASLAGALTWVIVWLLDLVASIEVPAEGATAFTIILMTATSYLVRDPQRVTSVPTGNGRHRADA